MFEISFNSQSGYIRPVISHDPEGTEVIHWYQMNACPTNGNTVCCGPFFCKKGWWLTHGAWSGSSNRLVAVFVY